MTRDPQRRRAQYVPRDLEDAFAERKRILSPAFVEQIRSRSEQDLIQLHFGLGLWMRNHCGLWAGSRLALWFAERGVWHPDDMSAIILVSFQRHLNGKAVDLEAQVAHYQAWWAAQGRPVSP